MAFQGDKEDSFYTDVPQGATNAIQWRPLMKEPDDLWVHDIPSISQKLEDGTVRYIRNYRTEPCVAVNRVGCDLDHMQDPFWSYLDQRTQYTKAGKRKDFGKKQKFLLAGYNYKTGRVEILDKGSQMFENMALMFNQKQDIRSIDWLLWKEGQSDRTEYHSSPVVDPARIGHIPQDQWPELERQAAELLKAARARYQPTPKAELLKIISGQENQETMQFPPAAAMPTLPQPQGPSVAFVPPQQALPPAQIPASGVIGLPPPTANQPTVGGVAGTAPWQPAPGATYPPAAPWQQPPQAAPVAPPTVNPPLAAPTFAAPPAPTFAPPAAPVFGTPSAPLPQPQTPAAPTFAPPAPPSFK
jgi:hypothetical protein